MTCSSAPSSIRIRLPIGVQGAVQGRPSAHMREMTRFGRAVRRRTSDDGVTVLQGRLRSRAADTRMYGGGVRAEATVTSPERRLSDPPTLPSRSAAVPTRTSPASADRSTPRDRRGERLAGATVARNRTAPSSRRSLHMPGREAASRFIAGAFLFAAIAALLAVALRAATAIAKPAPEYRI